MTRKIVLKIENYSNGVLSLRVPSQSADCAVRDIVSLCGKKYSGFIICEMSPPYKKRSTDVGGQNRHIWGHIQQIASETGNDVDDIEEYIKTKALKRGYPYHVNRLSGVMRPVSMREINTVEAGYLIDELHMLAAELGIKLDEGN